MSVDKPEPPPFPPPRQQQQQPQIVYVQQQPMVPKWSPGLAAVLSLIIPGMGQMYRGRVLIGILWLLFVIIGYGFFFFPGFILHIICIVQAATGNPYE